MSMEQIREDNQEMDHADSEYYEEEEEENELLRDDLADDSDMDDANENISGKAHLYQMMTEVDVSDAIMM